MTTEIAVMNKSAISLAADSAVTIGGGNKFYNTANKLFTLSKYHPIGIMVYSNAEFMGYPVETIIKEYRKKLGEKFFDTLEEYWDDFVKYIEENFSSEFGVEDLMVKVYALINALDKAIKDCAETKIENYINNSSGDDESFEHKQGKIKEIASESISQVISGMYNEYRSYKDDNNFSDKSEHIKSTIREKVVSIISSTIGSIDESNIEKILDIVAMVLTKKHSNGPRTGIVIAGFGEKDLFPKLVNANFMGVYFGVLKRDDSTVNVINNKNAATIIPFAQDDVISTFMTGIDQELQKNILDTIVKYEVDSCNNEKCIDGLKNEIKQKIDSWSRRVHINPIMETVEIAPKEELAQMAETLVNLTSFRRKLSMDAFSQSVGGPIDVALITKGDGFIWMKRKHYFDVNKNHHFIQNYFKNNWRDNYEFDNREESI
ncbi:hypothetical protein [Gudongella oleilytica]|uniref:hypothetical protein n=1 Tax=Gudongella oleilytica TaxID=1582259 RepID=UPI002A365290|nr:hypothetical protein [Gudongella oleilytica]MDY0256016.1 hypothetical protein [Gudongella oleilytica]